MSPTLSQLSANIAAKLQAGKGFSLDRNGAIMQGGYAVGLGKPQIFKAPIGKVTPKAIEAWLIDNWKLFHNPSLVLGGWVDDNGIAYLEPSELISDKAQAEMLGSLRGEQAIGDLALYSKGLDGTIWMDDKAA